MKRWKWWLAGTLALLSNAAVYAQDETNLQVHGYAAQGLLFSSKDNYIERHSSDGDLGWTDAAVSLAATPLPKLRVGMQVHYFRLGDLGTDSLAVDWALGDYKVNEAFGVRAGKVKTPLGLFNDQQDIDAVYLWGLLPQSCYQIDNRSFYLSHLGGEVYGSTSAAGRLGKFSYRVYAGENQLSTNGGYAEELTTLLGQDFNDPPGGAVFGYDLRWQSPKKSLLLGTSLMMQRLDGHATGISMSTRSKTPVAYGQFEKRRVSLAGEYRRQIIPLQVSAGGVKTTIEADQQAWYAMAAYRASSRLQVGTYYSNAEHVDGTPVFFQENNSKDLVFSARYDVNANFYFKAEDHFLHGTAIGFYPDDNPLGTPSRTNIAIAKLGFYF